MVALAFTVLFLGALFDGAIAVGDKHKHKNKNKDYSDSDSDDNNDKNDINLMKEADAIAYCAARNKAAEGTCNEGFCTFYHEKFASRANDGDLVFQYSYVVERLCPGGAKCKTDKCIARLIDEKKLEFDVEC
ncbi:hypothetical protein JDV02_009564 [Purpureocillium takamizusanense]|uniref:Uncharacterized protein n=1 Tax=Purpureocillium takamizusanense TaxID=2060973 RepID=A0A9Q8VFM0_9HYPO|nr:uncharacterized protein JDV02_009564 [Purpureocillium takamizusanense]UNI23763.1 hypothetical protein JDV02_009564 [Purpureocillium takamizusanense]